MREKRALKSAALAFLLVLTLGAAAFAAPTVRALPPSQDYRDLVTLTQRQVVDILIADAESAFRSPSRASTAGFTGKLQSNMEIVADKLLLAAELEPYRADLLFSAASAYIANGDTDKAIALYERILRLAPMDIDAHSYLLAWQRFKKNGVEVKRHEQFLKKFAPRRAAELRDVFSVIDDVTARPVRDTLPQEEAGALKGPVAIVTLGYMLNPDGSMNDILIQRLEKTLAVAEQLPDALLVVTGGVPKNNKTEARMMAQWLQEKGIDASRIVEDNAARSTVENALFSRYALARHEISSTVIISSGSHVRRAQTLYTIACKESGPANIRFIPVGTQDKPLAELEKVSTGELSGIYRDALKTMGLWSFRSYPLEER